MVGIHLDVISQLKLIIVFRINISSLFPNYVAPPVLEWKPKPSVQKQTCSEVLPEIASAKEAEKPLPTIPEHMDNEAPAKCLNPENLKSEDQQSVFIPEHLQVPEADSAGLSFGTFDMGFEKDFSGKLCLEDIKPIDSTVSSTKLLSEHLKKPKYAFVWLECHFRRF